MIGADAYSGLPANAAGPQRATASDRRRVDGVLLLDKPHGLSSNAALQRVKRLYRAEKAGHTGTLDPLATGVLPICFGEATKFANLLLDADKTYLATLRLGVKTTTGDAEGKIVAEHPIAVTRQQLEDALRRFVGRIAQTPPRHSALKRDGRNYYEYAREGIEIERQPREIAIHTIELLAWRAPEAEISVRCGKGTYIRSLAEDIGEALGCGAHLAALSRTAAGEFVLADASSLEALEQRDEAGRDALLLPIDAPVRRLASVELERADAERLSCGQALGCADRPDAIVRVYAGGAFAGLAEIRGSVMRARRMLAQPERTGAPPPKAFATRLNPKHFSG